ncbi:MAG TPA: hypothetical protein VF881_02685, partial [Polyangiaceae bacterium]
MTKGYALARSLALIALAFGSGMICTACSGQPDSGDFPAANERADGGKGDSAPSVIGLPDGQIPPADVSHGNCKPIACSTEAGTYCGQIGDGCGGTLDCGSCQGGRVCVSNVCSMPVDGCVPLTCLQVGGTYCGRIGDGCGRLLDCGNCASPLECGGGGIANVCGAAADGGACTPTVCGVANGQYCGVVGSGCGGKLDCGGCPAGQSCGVAGVANLCGIVGCTPGACTTPGGTHYCGVVGDGCGGKLDCGGCPSGQ